MTKLWKSVWVLGATVMGLGMSGLALGATGTGPYYATPSWDQQLPASTRFVVLSNWGTGTEAVLDRETGLVWEQSPRTVMLNWAQASSNCAFLSRGGRRGWRLPTIQDLASLVDPTQSNPALPSGHPFANVQSGNNDAYWASTTYLDFPSPVLAWVMGFNNGSAGGGFNKTSAAFVWCVRGGPGLDSQ